MVKRIDVDAKNCSGLVPGLSYPTICSTSFASTETPATRNSKEWRSQPKMSRRRLRWSLTSKTNVKTGKWVGGCFVYTVAWNRVCYLVGSESSTISLQQTLGGGQRISSYSTMYLMAYILPLGDSEKEARFRRAREATENETAMAESNPRQIT